jgi:hypothetical protein
LTVSVAASAMSSSRSWGTKPRSSVSIALRAFWLV